MTVSRAFQAAVVAALKADTAVAALLGARIYDGAPSDAKYPYVEIGPSFAVDADADCLTAEEETLQLDVWCSDQGRKGPCKDIVATIRAALHRQPLTLTEGHAVAVRVTLTRVLDDPDAIKVHGVLQLRAMLEA